MARQGIHILCYKCNGTGDGQETPLYGDDGLTTGEYETPDDCVNCNGVGVVLWGYLDAP